MARLFLISHSRGGMVCGTFDAIYGVAILEDNGAYKNLCQGMNLARMTCGTDAFIDGQGKLTSHRGLQVNTL